MDINSIYLLEPSWIYILSGSKQTGHPKPNQMVQQMMTAHCSVNSDHYLELFIVSAARSKHSLSHRPLFHFNTITE